MSKNLCWGGPGSVRKSAAKQKRRNKLYGTYLGSGKIIQYECRRLYGTDVPSDPIHDQSGYERMQRSAKERIILAYPDRLRFRREKYLEVLLALRVRREGEARSGIRQFSSSGSEEALIWRTSEDGLLVIGDASGEVARVRPGTPCWACWKCCLGNGDRC